MLSHGGLGAWCPAFSNLTDCDISPIGDCKGTGGMETAGGDGTTSKELWGVDPRTFS